MLRCVSNEINEVVRECAVDKTVETCAEGYEGPLCSICSNGFGKSNGQCLVCPDPALDYIFGIVGLVVIAGVYSYLIYATVKEHGLMDRSTIICRILVSNFLVLSVFQAIPIDWAPGIFWYLSVGNSASEPPINLECLFKHRIGENFVFVKPLIYLIMPLIATAMLGLFWCFQYRRHLGRIKKEHGTLATKGDTVYSAALDVIVSKRLIKQVAASRNGTNILHASRLVSLDAIVTFTDKFMGSLVVLQYMLLPNAVRQTFAYLDCGRLTHNLPPISSTQMEKYNDDPDTYLMHFPDPNMYIRTNAKIRCYDERHNQWLAFVFTPALIIYCVGIPLWWFYMLYKHRKSVYTLPVSRIKFGFITGGYEPQYWYWELICQFRKTLLIGVSAFFSSLSVVIRCIICSLILLASLYLQVEAAPFEDANLDNLEKISLLTSLTTILLGLVFNESAVQGAGKIVLVVALLMLNSFFLYSAGRQFVKEKWKEMTRDNSVIAKKLKQKKKGGPKVSPGRKKVLEAGASTAAERARKSWGVNK